MHKGTAVHTCTNSGNENSCFLAAHKSRLLNRNVSALPQWIFVRPISTELGKSSAANYQTFTFGGIVLFTVVNVFAISYVFLQFYLCFDLRYSDVDPQVSVSVTFAKGKSSTQRASDQRWTEARHQIRTVNRRQTRCLFPIDCIPNPDSHSTNRLNHS